MDVRQYDPQHDQVRCVDSIFVTTATRSIERAVGFCDRSCQLPFLLRACLCARAELMQLASPGRRPFSNSLDHARLFVSSCSELYQEGLTTASTDPNYDTKLTVLVNLRSFLNSLPVSSC